MPAECRERLPVKRVGVRRADDVGPRCVHLRVDRIRGTVDHSGSLDNFALVIDEQEIADSDMSEVSAERIHPETIGALRIARGEVTGDPLIEAEAREQPISGGQALLSV
jgi:hypothetical protein